MTETMMPQGEQPVAGRGAGTLYMIGNAHIDPVWLWRWQEGCHEVLASFRSALDRLNEEPDFLFISSSAAFYAWVEQLEPAMFEEIRARVREGRWAIVGGWWIQPDCNIPSGESFVRQGLYGQRYFKEKFGVTARVGYNVDSFGHNGALPQILKRSGLDSYVFMRPGPQEKGLPARLFWWEADDGSRVLAYRLPFEYGTGGRELDRHIGRCAAELREPLDELMCFYGVGNHGGGPTIENLWSIRRLAADPALPTLIFSTPDRYFEAIRARDLPLPTVHDELQHHASGGYAAHSGIKYWNRRAEWAVLTAEKWAAVAARVVGLPYPTAEFARAWRGVLFNQFHDILAGTSIESAYVDARNLHGEALTIADRALNAATLALCWRMAIPQEEGATPLVVFNPHAWPATMKVEAEFARLTDEHGLLDDAGRAIPWQLVQSESVTNGRSRLAFVADLPPLGYRVYRVVRGAAPQPESPVIATDTTLENECLRLTIDPATGYLLSLYDKRHVTEALIAPGAVPSVLRDESDTWSHNVFSFRDEIGRFRATSVRLIAHGPVESTIRVISEYGRSRLVQDFALRPGSDLIEVSATVDWHEHFRALKLRFPINVHFHRVTSEIPYGSIERAADGTEEPGGSWLDISGSGRQTNTRYGVSLLNDGKYSYDVDVRDMGLMILRSPIYAHHNPAVPQPDTEYRFIDQGVQRFRYALYPHADGWEAAGTVRRAAELNAPLIAMVATGHPHGLLPLRAGFATTTPDTIVITALKEAEDGDALIVRAYESARTATRATIDLPGWGRTIEAAFGPAEIKTFRVPYDTTQPPVEVNMLEWED